MKSEQELAEFYTRLKNELNETTKFPTQYLYKFIIPNEAEKEIQLRDIFKTQKAEIKTRPSSNEKYIGVSVSVLLNDADQVIFYYKEAGKVEGILSL